MVRSGQLVAPRAGADSRQEAVAQPSMEEPGGAVAVEPVEVEPVELEPVEVEPVSTAPAALSPRRVGGRARLRASGSVATGQPLEPAHATSGSSAAPGGGAPTGLMARLAALRAKNGS